MPRPSSPKPYRLTVVRYTDPDGKRCRKGDPGAKKFVEETLTYYADLWDAGVRERVSLDTSDEGQAWVNLNRVRRERAERAVGIRDDYIEQAARPLADHLGEWEAALRDRGGSEARIKLMRGRLDQLAALAGWKRVTDLDHDSCRRGLARLAKLDPPQTSAQGKGRGAQTRNHYLSHAKQFARWLWEGHRIRVHPLAAVRPVSVEVDRRHDRRVPTDGEVGRLLGYLLGPAAETRCGMTGRRRALGYQVCMATGLRAGELRRVERVDLDLKKKTLDARAAYAKNKKRALIPLPSWLVKDLADWFAAGGGLWDAFPPHNPGRLLKDDLAAAKVAYVKGALFLDFHALRHWYVTAVASTPGIDPKTLMTLARHSDPRLTLKVYAKAKEKSLRKVADGIKAIGPRRRDEEE